MVLALGDGRFRSVEVVPGAELGDWIEIVKGLNEGDTVVTSGQFLIDSEASLSGLDVRSVAEAPDAKADAARAADDKKPATFSATGTIDKIAARSVTLKHGPVPRLDWPAMTMTFATSGPAQLRGFKRGDRVRFTFTQNDSGPRIVSIRRSGE